MKKFLIWCLICPLAAFSQKTHTVAPKETLFSIGRMYNVHPRELASFNNIPFETGLTIGQVINIPGKTSLPPLPKDHAAQVESKPSAATTPAATNTVPVYHIVAPKETLYQISKKNNTTVAEIKKWNRLTDDALKTGTKLVVGYKKETVKQQESIAKAITPVPVMEKPEPKEEVNAVPEVKKEVPVPEVKKESLPVATAPVAQAIEETAKPPAPSLLPGEGYFSNAYAEQITGKDKLHDEKGTAAVFKSTSGWEDGKYYCLYNKAEPGTIVKITHSETRQSVYAKVLDVMPDMKQNAGILIRISNAAAAKLGAVTESFDCTITY